MMYGFRTELLHEKCVSGRTRSSLNRARVRRSYQSRHVVALIATEKFRGLS